MKRWIIKPGQKLTADLLKYQQSAIEEEIERRYADLFDGDSGEVLWEPEGSHLTRETPPYYRYVVVKPGVFLVKGKRVEIPKGENKEWTLPTGVYTIDSHTYYSGSTGNRIWAAGTGWNYILGIKPIDVLLNTSDLSKCESGYYLNYVSLFSLEPNSLVYFLETWRNDGFLIIARFYFDSEGFHAYKPRSDDEIAQVLRSQNRTDLLEYYVLKQLKIDPVKFSTRVLKANVESVGSVVPLHLTRAKEGGLPRHEIEVANNLNISYGDRYWEDKTLELSGSDFYTALDHTHTVTSEDQVAEGSIQIFRVESPWNKAIQRIDSGYKVFTQTFYINEDELGQDKTNTVPSFTENSVCFVSALDVSCSTVTKIEISGPSNGTYTITTRYVRAYKAFVFYK